MTNNNAQQFFWVVNREHDNVAVCLVDVEAGTAIEYDGRSILINELIPKGNRFALVDIPEGKDIIQYGYCFAISQGIKVGEKVSKKNIMETERRELSPLGISEKDSGMLFAENLKISQAKFMGYKRKNGEVGSRNYYIILPLSQCSSAVCTQIEKEAAEKFDIFETYKNIDGIIALPNTEGCGCASNVQIDRFLTIIKNYIFHPNVSKVLAVDLGCEQTNCERIKSILSSESGLDQKVDFISIQELGGIKKTINYALKTIEKNLEAANDICREECSLEKVVLGTECGGSDAFSGITANSLIGQVADLINHNNGSVLLSEIPEMVGAEDIILYRCKNYQTQKKFINIMNWYLSEAKKAGKDLSDNLVPENIHGGLINPAIKSLGAIVKGGTGSIVDVLEYGEKIRMPGLNIMQGPGNDLESVTGLTASGANVICFSTGKGTVTGSALVPVIKIVSTSERYKQLRDDMDFNAGKMIEGNRSDQFSSEITDELFDMLIRVLSGEKTKAEINSQRQFQIWTTGKVSL